jgi:hypothetical protein
MQCWRVAAVAQVLIVPYTAVHTVTDDEESARMIWDYQYAALHETYMHFHMCCLGILFSNFCFFDRGLQHSNWEYSQQSAALGPRLASGHFTSCTSTAARQTQPLVLCFDVLHAVMYLKRYSGAACCGQAPPQRCAAACYGTSVMTNLACNQYDCSDELEAQQLSVRSATALCHVRGFVKPYSRYKWLDHQ